MDSKEVWGYFLMLGVRMLHFLNRFMKIYSNPTILYYGFKNPISIVILQDMIVEHKILLGMKFWHNKTYKWEIGDRFKYM